MKVAGVLVKLRPLGSKFPTASATAPLDDWWPICCWWDFERTSLGVSQWNDIGLKTGLWMIVVGTWSTE